MAVGRAEQDAHDFGKTDATHCTCCGAIRMNCVCFGSMTTDMVTGEHTSVMCSPKDHGRTRYGFG